MQAFTLCKGYKCEKVKVLAAPWHPMHQAPSQLRSLQLIPQDPSQSAQIWADHCNSRPSDPQTLRPSDLWQIGECACTNIRNGLTTATHKRKTLSDAEIKARCTTCPAFPCDEYKYADANCNYWQSCADWILRADEENS